MRACAVMLVSIALLGCSQKAAVTPYCAAVASPTPTRALAVRDVYVYGTLYHGSLLISPACIRPVYSFYSFQDAVSDEPGARDRIRHFNQVVYNAPAVASGMFRIEGLVSVNPDTKVAELYDISAFREVDEEEARSVLR